MAIRLALSCRINRLSTQIMLFLILGCLRLSSGQTLEYDVSINEHPSGTSQITKTLNSDGSFKTRLNLLIDAHMLVHIQMHFEGYALTKEGVLQKSEVSVHNNGHLHSHTSTVLENGSYTILKDKKEISPPSGNIGLTGYDLYFGPPTHTREIYSLSNGSMEVAKEIDSRTFEIMDSNNQKSVYKYNENGIAHYVKISHKLYDIEFKLKE